MNGRLGQFNAAHRPPRDPESLARRRRRRLAVLPSLFTIANAICGFAAIVQVASLRFDASARVIANPENLVTAGWLVLLAMVFDMFDGRIARLTRTTGNFGGELDSLCDAISFGVAPGLMVAMINSKAITNPFFAKVAWVCGLAFACGAILRLARFNVENTDHSESAHQAFKGLPSPAAAGTIATLFLLQGFLRSDREALVHLPDSVLAVLRTAAEGITTLLPFVALFVAYLMVSRVRYIHLANRYLRGRRSTRHIAQLVFPALIFALLPEVMLALGFVAFALSGPIGAAWRRLHGMAAAAAAASQAPPAPAPSQVPAQVGPATSAEPAPATPS